MMMLDPQRLQILLEVLARAPVTRAEQVIIQEVVDQLLAMVEQIAPPAPAQQETPSQVPVGNGVDR
jgi:hypothetical protein